MSDIAKTAAGTGARRAWIGVGVPILGLLAVIITLSVATFASFAHDQDDAFTQTSSTLVASGLAGRAQATGNVGLDYANWQDAFDHISEQWDQEWVEGNFYSSVVEGMILFRADGAVRYSWFKEEFAGQAEALTAAVAQAASNVPTLRRLARAPTPAETVVHTYARVGDQLIVIAVAPITPEEDAIRIAYNPLRGYDYLATLEVLDAHDFAKAGVSMSLQEFQFAASSDARGGDTIAVPVVAADGDHVGQLQWRHTHPGSASFQHKIWPVILSLLCVGALTLLIARQLVVRQVGAMAHGEAALESSRLKAEFLTKVGHELRTPLNGIIGYAEIIHEETDSATTREDADRIVSAARHLNIFERHSRPVASRFGSPQHQARSAAGRRHDSGSAGTHAPVSAYSRRDPHRAAKRRRELCGRRPRAPATVPAQSRRQRHQVCAARQRCDQNARRGTPARRRRCV